MRAAFLALLLLTTAAPGLAQSDRVDRRVGKLEDEMRAVQRKVFPNGQPLQPEIAPPDVVGGPAGTPATSAVADLTARVDALENQLARITGQTEENANRLRELEATWTQYRADAEARLGRLEGAGLSAPADGGSGGEPPVELAPPPPETDVSLPSDPAEAGYIAGYRMWEAGQFAEAQAALEAVGKQHPKHKRASWARNLAGRAALDAGKPAAAAKILLANYQYDAKGERAADSLYFLGQALVTLKKTAEACQAYDELDTVYGSGLRDYLRDRLPQARTAAKCG